MVREITNSGKYGIIACIEDEYLINYKSILNIILKDDYSHKIDLKFILAVINSSLLTWYFNISSNKIVTNTFPRISIYDLKEFSINLSNTLIQNQIADNLSQILTAKTNNSIVDTTTLESEIDRLVYQLYGLTDEEIKIVEGK